MAKLFFVGQDGTEKSYQLQTHRPFTVGRDPGNDVILRDPKVSRRHAEIVFERGFFVIHDLASANGTFINGRRVRVAPLTNGAKLRLGNSHGHFTEEPAAAGEDVHPGSLEIPLPDADATVVPGPGNGILKLDTVPHEQYNVKKNSI